MNSFFTLAFKGKGRARLKLGDTIKFFILLVLSINVYGQVANEQPEKTSPIEKVTGILKGTKGTISLGSIPYTTFAVVGSNVSIIIEAKNRNRLTLFRKFFEKDWIKKNSSTYTKAKLRLCFTVTGKVYTLRDRTFIFPTGDIKFFRTSCKVKGPMKSKRLKCNLFPNGLKLNIVEPPIK